MYNPKLGLKRSCNSCNTRFYDFGKRPPVCPKCHTPVDLEVMYKSKRSRAGEEKETPEVVVNLFETELGIDVAEDDALLEDAADLDIGDEEPVDVLEEVVEDEEDR